MALLELRHALRFDELGTRSLKFWTRADDEELLRLRNLGTSAREIADNLSGRSTQSVEKRIRSFKGDQLTTNAGHLRKPGRRRRKNWTRADDEKLLRLCRKGKRLYEVRPHFLGRTLHAVELRISKLVKLGLLERSRRTVSWTKDED